MALHTIDCMTWPSPYRQVVAARATTDAADWAVEVEVAKYWPYTRSADKPTGKGRSPGRRARFTTHTYTDWRIRCVADDSQPPMWGGVVRILYQGRQASRLIVQPVDTLPEAVKRLKAKFKNAAEADTRDLAVWLDTLALELEARS